MPYDGTVQGRWAGRLVDVLGFEGEIAFELRQDKKGRGVAGSFDVAIGVNHASMRQRGAVQGAFAKGVLELTFEAKAGNERPVVIHLAGRVQSLKGGGAGLKATYEVAAHGFSPLQGGIVCASAGVPPTSVAIQPERTAVVGREDRRTGRPPARAAAKGTRRKKP